VIKIQAINSNGVISRPPIPVDDVMNPQGEGLPSYSSPHLCCENEKFQVYTSTVAGCGQEDLDMDENWECRISPSAIWYKNEYRVAAAGAIATVEGIIQESSDLATLVHPVPGAILPGPTVDLVWTAATKVTEPPIRGYYVSFGTTQGNKDLGFLRPGSSLNDTIIDLPTDGSTIYVTLWSTVPTIVSLVGKMTETIISDTNGIHGGFKWGDVTHP